MCIYYVIQISKSLHWLKKPKKIHQNSYGCDSLDASFLQRVWMIFISERLAINFIFESELKGSVFLKVNRIWAYFYKSHLNSQEKQWK